MEKYDPHLNLSPPRKFTENRKSNGPCLKHVPDVINNLIQYAVTVIWRFMGLIKKFPTIIIKKSFGKERKRTFIFSPTKRQIVVIQLTWQWRIGAGRPTPPYVRKYLKFLGVFRKIWFRFPFCKILCPTPFSRKSGSATACGRAYLIN